MTQRDESDSPRHEAALAAVSVMDALERDEVMEAYGMACTSLMHYAGALQDAGVETDQVCSQLHSAVVAVVWRALGIKR